MSELLVERHGPSVVITINRPESLNSLSPSLLKALPATLRESARSRSCRSIILTGSGERAFCAGIDVKSVAAGDAAAQNQSSVVVSPEQQNPDRLDPVAESFENLHLVLSDIVRVIHSLPVPIIAAVNGHAIGAGLAIAASCELRIGSENATFADGFIKRGTSGCEMGLSYFLPKIIGQAKAGELMLTGRRIGATEAEAIGLIGQVTMADELVSKALELGERLAEIAPLDLTLTKEVMWSNLHAGSLDQALALESRTQVMARNTADAAEARQAFLDKRQPEFQTPASPRPVR